MITTEIPIEGTISPDSNLYIDILILGAGPTGLMMSNQLVRFGIDHIILDQKAGPTDQSRALVVHARSMEIYEQLGLSDAIVAKGQKNVGMELFKKGKRVASVTVVNPDENATPFPWLMMFEQSKNEALLYNNLLTHNRDVQWNATVVSISRKDNQYIVEVICSQQKLTYQCKYLIACDGSNSIVREYAQMPFIGSSYMNVFYVADTHADGSLSSTMISLFLQKSDITVFFPMTGKDHFRILGILPVGYYHKEDLPFDEILRQVKGNIGMTVSFYDTGWHSTYRLHHKKVESFRKDNIFFAGDAAHVHSPVGGQGMNTGLQDVYNLSWKLALVVQGKAGFPLLDSYHEERDPVAGNLLKSTDRMFSFMSTNTPFYNFIRLRLVPLLVSTLTSSRAVKRALFRNVSQINISYKTSSLAKGKAGQISAGQRLPYFCLTQQGVPVSIYKLVNFHPATPFTVLLYNIPGDHFTGLHKDFFRIVSLEVNTSNTTVLRKKDLPQSFVMVVRPDNYIAYISEEADVSGLLNFMTAAYCLYL
jgi:2-polyprenyl-6-methoxyphenol hydroxylase-like FAD-dependent oxidoreductase